MPRAKDKEAILLFPFICNGVLAVLFRGTIDSTSVNRRGVVTAALRLIRQPYSLTTTRASIRSRAKRTRH